MVEALKQSTAEKEAALHAQMASAMEEEKRKLDEQRKQSHDDMQRQLAEMREMMAAQLKAEAERAAAAAAEKEAALAEREAALAKQAEYEKTVALERAKRLELEEAAKAQQQISDLEKSVQEEDAGASAAVEQDLKKQLAAFEAKLKEEQEKAKSGFEEQKRLREKLIREQEERLKASKEAQAAKRMADQTQAEANRLARQKKTAEEKAANVAAKKAAEDRAREKVLADQARQREATAAAASEADEDAQREKAMREKAKQDARAALAMGMKGASGVEAKLKGSFDTLNLKQPTPKINPAQMFKKPVAGGVPMSAMGASQSNNPFAIPSASGMPAPIPPSSNPFALPQSSAPPPAIPQRSTAAGAIPFNISSGQLLSSTHSTGHPGAQKAVAQPTAAAYNHSARTSLSSQATDYFGSLSGGGNSSSSLSGNDLLGDAPVPSTSPFGPVPTSISSPSSGTTPFSAAAQTTPFSGGGGGGAGLARRASKDEFKASQPADPYSNPSRIMSDDFDPDFDPTKWNGKGGSASGLFDASSSIPASPQSNGAAQITSSLPSGSGADSGAAAVDNDAEERARRFKMEKIQQMMDLQREHMANRAAAAETEKKLAERHAEAQAAKHRPKLFSFSKKKSK